MQGELAGAGRVTSWLWRGLGVVGWVLLGLSTAWLLLLAVGAAWMSDGCSATDTALGCQTWFHVLATLVLGSFALAPVAWARRRGGRVPRHLRPWVALALQYALTFVLSVWSLTGSA